MATNLESSLPLETFGKHIYSITEITREIKNLLESNIPTVWVQGEISNFKIHSSGHMYFSLKDEGAQIPCVMWRWNNHDLYFTPQDGMKVLAQGNITVYEKRGYYQLDVLQLTPAGIGELQLAFERLKNKLRAEGLFDERYKKPLPSYPERIGIVTSPTGAAIRDLVSIIRRRFPSVQLILNPVRVQGDGAAQEIATAITEFNEYGQVELIIVGRGGGSLEDLWAFNEEVVARAIFNSKIPVISAVGHEIDFSISDFVADLRAPTPSAAAELAVRNREELLEMINGFCTKINQALSTKIQYFRERIHNLERSYALRKPTDLIKQYSQRVDELAKNLETALSHRIQLMRENVDSMQKRLGALNPCSVLKRGYSICYKTEDGRIVRRAAELTPEDKIRVRFYEGKILGTVDIVEA